MDDPITENEVSRLEDAVASARRLGAAGAKVWMHASRDIACEFENGRLKRTGGSQARSFGIEVLMQGRRGSTAGNRWDDLDRLLAEAVSLAGVGSVAHFPCYPSPERIQPVKMYSDRTAALSRETLVDGCQQIADHLRHHDSTLTVGCQAGRREAESVLVTSGGVRYRSRRTTWSLGAHVQRTVGTDMTFAWEGRAWSDFNALFDPGAIGGQIVAQLARAERTMEPPRGRVQVLVSPRVLDRLLTCFILGIHGRNVARGNSPLAGRLGQPVLAPTLTVVDHPQVDFSPGASEVDGDGIPCSRRVVFEKGVLKEFLYDLDSAGLAGAKPTGHTACQPHWLMVLPGECTSRELLGELKDGLWIESLIGFGQGNLINGDFSANVGLGYRVQNGEVTGRVKNTMVSGNLYECFARNVTPSSDLNYDGRLPFAAVEGVQCTG